MVRSILVANLANEPCSHSLMATDNINRPVKLISCVNVIKKLIVQQLWIHYNAVLAVRL